MFHRRFVPQLISTACSFPFLRSLLVEKLSSCLSLFLYENLLLSLPRDPSSCSSSTRRCCLFSPLICFSRGDIRSSTNRISKSTTRTVRVSVKLAITYESVELRVSATCSMRCNMNPTRREFFVALA